jgi:hypothetical protein
VIAALGGVEGILGHTLQRHLFSIKHHGPLKTPLLSTCFDLFSVRPDSSPFACAELEAIPTMLNGPSRALRRLNPETSHGRPRFQDLYLLDISAKCIDSRKIHLWTQLVPQRRFNRILQWFVDGSLASFVTVMHETGSVITGSCALNMLLVDYYDSSTSDLNFLENDNIFTSRRGLHQNRKRRESPFDSSFAFYCYRLKRYHKRRLSVTLSVAGKLERTWMKVATIIGVLIPRSLVKTFPSTSPNSTVNTVLNPSLLTLYNEAIAVNSTAFQDDEKDTRERVFVGSKTETVLLNFTKELGWPNYKGMRDAAQIIQIIPFSSERKAMGTMVKLAHGYRLYVKGASATSALKHSIQPSVLSLQRRALQTPTTPSPPSPYPGLHPL